MARKFKIKTDSESIAVEELLSSIGSVIRERGASYGSAQENFRVVAVFLNEILRKKLQPGEWITEIDVADCMVGLKLARIITGDSPDSRKDLAGYGILGASMERSSAVFDAI